MSGSEMAGRDSSGEPSPFGNTYDDAGYARAYADLEFPGTYFLAFRDLPAILVRHVQGGWRALDFGCGTGRSTRFLRGLGFDVVGADVSPAMLRHALARDPTGDYRLLGSGGVARFAAGGFDLVLSTFTFDNIPSEEKPAILRDLASALNRAGRLVSVVSSPDIYVNEWVSFSTKDFPGNASARPGDVVRCLNRAIADERPAEDVLCTDEDHRAAFAAAALDVEAVYRPLARGDEGVAWVNETRIAPWVIYVVRRRG